MELFHGPTFAFKDVALQFLGNVFEYFLEEGKIQKSITILGVVVVVVVIVIVIIILIII